MSIKTDNRSIALRALSAFQAFEEEYMRQEQAANAEMAKHLLNAVQQAGLELGTQGLKRCMLYVSGQMVKDGGKKGEQSNGTDHQADKPDGEGKKKDGDTAKKFGLPQAYLRLYEQMAQFVGIDPGSFQYYILAGADCNAIAELEARLAFFLLCLKRLAATACVENNIK